jgi:hypothetical protein
MWKAFAFFDPKGESKPAWTAFEKSRDKRAKPKKTICLEVLDGKIHVVPIAEAREKAAPILAAKLKKFGRVNMDYINDVTAEKLTVAGYRVALRASISGNLDLMLQPDAPAITVAGALKNLDPIAQRVVIFARDANEPLVARVAEAAKKSGIEAVVHPIEADKPLKFGLGGVESDAAY